MRIVRHATRPALAALSALVALLPAAAWAEDRPALSAPAFEALTEGRIMDHFEAGSRYGAEEYLPGRRAIWQDAEGCMTGRWFEAGGLICFVYDGQEGSWCWTYHPDAEGLTARLDGDPAARPILLRPSGLPLTCPQEQPLS